MRILFTPVGWRDYQYWRDEDVHLCSRVTGLIDESARTPFTGRGKPEPLKNDFKGWWSRRIDAEHRLIYRVTGKGDSQVLEVAQCRFHC